MFYKPCISAQVPEEDVCDWQSTYNDKLVSCEPVTRHVLYAQTTLDNCTVVEDWESTFAEEGRDPLLDTN